MQFLTAKISTKRIVLLAWCLSWPVFGIAAKDAPVQVTQLESCDEKLMCDSRDLSQAAAMGMPKFIDVEALLEESGAQVHRTIKDDRQVIGVRGQPTARYPRAVLNLVQVLTQRGFTEESRHFGPRVFTTADQKSLLILDTHNVKGELQISIAYWQESLIAERL